MQYKHKNSKGKLLYIILSYNDFLNHNNDFVPFNELIISA